MRTIKEPEVRKNEILDIANSLFSHKGYDHTSISDILEQAGIAKGTLYYHFKSKEEIMNAIIDRILIGMLDKAKTIAQDGSLTVHEKLLHVVMSLHLDEENEHGVMEHIHTSQNALMHQKQLDALVRGVTPILSSILEEGILQGLFTTSYPYESSEMLLIYSQIAFDQQDIPTQAEAERKIAAFICNMERILGAQTGSFSFMAQLFIQG